MEALGIAASVVGVVGPALHCVRQLMTDIQKIVDAPDAVKALKDNLITIDKDLASLQTISDRQWESLGQAVLEQSKAAIALCAESCQKFRTTLARLTRHSNLDQGKLSRRDRVMIGFFSRDEFKSMSEELQSCKHTLNLAVTVAVLHGSFRQGHETELGASHALTLHSMLLLADTIRLQGRFKEAEELQVRTMKANKTDLGVYNDEALAAMEEHGKGLFYLDRFEEAQKILMHVLKAREEQLGPDHDDTMSVKHDLGNTLLRQNQFCEAEKMLLQVIAARKAKHGDDDLDTMASMFALGEVFHRQDRFGEAEALDRQVMEGRKKKLGRDHPQTIGSMEALAANLHDQGRFKDAEEIFSEIFEICRTTWPNSESTFWATRNLAVVWKGQGRHQEALELMKSCARDMAQILGEGHPDTQGCLQFVDDWTKDRRSSSPVS